MSNLNERVYISATEEGHLDISVPEGGVDRPLNPVELLLLGVFMRSSNDEEWTQDLMEYVVNNYSSYFKSADGSAEEAAE